MPLVPQQHSPSIVPSRNSREAALAISALADRIALLERRTYPGASQVLPAYSTLNGSSQAANTIEIISQGGGGGGSGGGGTSLSTGVTAVAAAAWNVPAPGFSTAIVAMADWNTDVYLEGGNLNFGTSAPPFGGNVYWIHD